MAEAAWWQRGTIYQIYPRSFQDGDGDGIGDLAGIRQRLPYLEWLGVDAVWISPFYPSPMADFGYDIADYRGIDPVFGTPEDFDALVADLHGRGLKLILDFVPNHSSDRHPWFADSRASRDSARRDWYIWRDPAPDGGPPNNWISNFGGSAWEFDERTGQYYYHAFLREQPDLNWRNPALRAAMHDVLRFWLDRGVDGFRVDVIWHLAKDPGFRDNPPNPGWREDRPDIERLLQVHSCDQPEIHDIIAGMRAVLDEYDDRVLIGEIYLPLERLVAYYGEDLSGAHLPFNFLLLNTAWDARHVGRLVDEYEQALPAGGWPNWVLGNHDQKRIASRVGARQARVAAMLLLTLRGTPTLYYGDEIGMEQVAIPDDRVQDPWERNEPGQGFGRDPQRTPMPWSAGDDPGDNPADAAGFTTGRPWLPLGPRDASRTVEGQRRDAGSILCLYRRLLHLRRSRAALALGGYERVEADGDVFAFRRMRGDDRLLVALNLGHAPQTLAVPLADRRGRIVLSSSGGREGETVGGRVALAGDEGVIIDLAP